MNQVGDLDPTLTRAVQLEESADPIPDFSWEAVRGRRTPYRPVRRIPTWRWWLALAVAGTCLSGTAAAMASPAAAGTMQQVLAKIHLLQARTVTFVQARADAGYGLVDPAGLPTGTRLQAISELPAVGSAPAEFLFQYQIEHRTRNGPFEIAEAPAGRGSGPGFYAVAVNGALSIFGGRPASSPAPPGAVSGTALLPGGPHMCATGRQCAVHLVPAGGTAAGDGAAGSPNAPGPTDCPKGEVCVVTRGRPGHGTVTVAPVRGGAAGLSAHATAVSWTVAGTELHLINPGTLTPAEVQAIRAATKGS